MAWSEIFWSATQVFFARIDARSWSLPPGTFLCQKNVILFFSEWWPDAVRHGSSGQGISEWNRSSRWADPTKVWCIQSLSNWTPSAWGERWLIGFGRVWLLLAQFWLPGEGSANLSKEVPTKNALRRRPHVFFSGHILQIYVSFRLDPPEGWLSGF